MADIRKKIILNSELNYLFSLILITLAVAMLTSAGFGLSMVVAPAFVLAEFIPNLTFGQAGYILYGVQFILMCFLLKGFRPSLLISFLTVVIYGVFLDLWQLIPLFNITVTPPDSLELWVRIVFFVGGILLTTFSVALSFKTYIYPQVYDFFVKAVSDFYKIKLATFKYIVDFSFLAIAIALSFIFFGKLVGVSWGTVVMAITSGTLVSFFSNLLDKFSTQRPFFNKLSKYLTDQLSPN